MLPLYCNQNTVLYIMKRVYKVSEIIKMLETDGWQLDRQKGSHRQFKHPFKKGVVTVNGKLSDTLDRFLLSSISKQSGLKF